MPRVLKSFLRSVRAKIAVIILTAVTIAVVSASMIQAWRMAEDRYQSLHSEMQGVAATIATAIAPAQARGDYHEVMRTLRAIGRMPKVPYASIVDNDGQLIARFGNGVILSRDTEVANRRTKPGLFELLSIRQFPLEAPVIEAGSRIATLTMIADASELGTALSESIIASLAAGIVAAMIALAIAFRLQGAVTGPILSLKQAMLSIQESHDYSSTVKRTSSDEIGDLVDAFNTMLSEIRQRDAALTRHRETLEMTVEERTRDLRTATQAAEQANAAKSEFLAAMSHEIRTPMNGMLVMAELLTASNLSTRLRRYADVIVTSGRSLLSIINDILDFSKMEAGKLEFEAIPVEPRKLVDETTRLFAQRAAGKGLDIAGIVAPDVPEHIIADPVRLNQVLANLVNNALKFTETGGVTIRIARTGTNAFEPHTVTTAQGGHEACELVFSVTDTGIGIPEDRVGTIFEAFAQADQSTTRKFGGTGIGLTICQRLAACMGGHIGVTSRLGEGSTFTLRACFPVLTSTPAIPGVHKDEPVDQAAVPGDATQRPVLAISLPDGITRDCLMEQAAGHGFEPAAPEALPGLLAASPGRNVIAVIGRPPWPDLANRPGTSSPPAHVRLESIGEGDGEGSDADALLSWPVGHDELRLLFESLRTGDLSALRPDRAPETAKAPDIAFRDVHVLAADDSPVNREVLGEALNRLGITMKSVENGLKAVEAIRSQSFDLVFMDGSMPEMDGFEATRAIRDWEQREGRKATPVIALTAHVVGAQAELWKQAGMNDCVTKPFTIDMLQSCLLRWLPEVKRADKAKTANPEEQPVGGSRPEEPAGQTELTEPVLADAGELLDASVLEEIAGMQSGDNDLVARIIRLYREHAPSALRTLEDVIDHGAPSANVAAAAHALESLSRNIGALAVSELCEVMETEARGVRADALAGAGPALFAAAGH